MEHDELGITQIQTAVRGREAGVEIIIEEVEESTDKVFLVSCPKQKAESETTKTRHKVIFDKMICEKCEHKEYCQTTEQKPGNVYYFTEEDAIQNKRVRNIYSIPEDRRRLRNNIEATVKEFTIGYNHKGKLRVRGWFKAMFYTVTRAIAINFGRIFRHILKNFGKNSFFDYLYATLCTVIGVFLFLEIIEIQKQTKTI